MSTLGAPNLIRAPSEPVKFRTRKHLALLIRLAVEPGRRITRDSLVDLLWPDAPPHHAHHSLAQAVSVLKGKVGREYVLVQKATLALADGAVDVDLGHLDDCDLDVRGPFLDGFEIPGTVTFEQWKDEWRARLAPRIRDCLVKQMDAGRRVGDFAAVERSAQVLYDLDPLSEDAVRGMMEARAWVGDRGNALKIYARFAARLGDELGAQPGPDLARVANLLREGRPSVARVHDATMAPAPTPGRGERRFEAETLIGRGKEFAALYDNWLEIRGRRPRVVVLTGDAGVGKTTLTNAFASSCQMEGAIVARAQAYDAERELPFAVLAELARQLAAQRAIGCADPQALSELARIAPEIFAVFPGVPKPTDWAAEVTPLRLADAFLKAITAAGDENPVILVVDDIHAADNASSAILHVVARKLEGTRVLLILAGRSSELRVSDAAAALASDTVIEGLRAIELDALAPEAAGQLVGRLAAGADPRYGEPPAERILRAASGNPLAIELLTREWAAHGPESLLHDLEALDTLPAPSLGIPRAIRAVFERQAQRLDARTRAVLDLAAVLGRRLGDLSLYAAVECPPGTAGEALSRLREDGILREVRGELEFRNELIRAQAYYAVAVAARQHLHRRVAELLATQPEPRRRSLDLEIAWHWIRGGDIARAFSHGLSGAAEALNVGAPYEAEQILLALNRQPGPVGAGVHVSLLLCKALLDQSKANAAAVLLDEIICSATASTRELAEAHRMQAAAEYLLSPETGNKCIEAADHALQAARQLRDAQMMAQALFESARAGAEFGQEERVRKALLELIELSQQVANVNNPTILHALGFCHFFFFEIRVAAACLERAIRALTSAPNGEMLNHIYNGYAMCMQYLCQFPRAEAAYVTALRLAQRIGDDSRSSIIASNLSALRCIQGDYEACVALAQYSIKTAGAGGSQPRTSAAYATLAEAYILDGKADKAFECMGAARRLVARERSWRAQVAFLADSANFDLLTGQTTAAIETIAALEEILSGKEGAASDLGLVTRLRVYRAAHVREPEFACSLASEARDRFRNRNLLFYLDALSAYAWAERRAAGQLSKETEDELLALDVPDLAGKKALLMIQGFIS